MSVAIMVPTRDRPKELAHLVGSALQTSPDVRVLAYIDQDQRQLYQWVDEHCPPNLIVHWGVRVGPVAAANQLVREHPEFDAYGFFCDDVRVTIPGWDKVVLDKLGAMPGGVGVVAPAHARKDVDFPFVSRKWIEALGWYCQPGLYHWGWPSVIAALGEGSQTLYQATPGEFWFHHDILAPKNRDRYPQDIVMLYDYFAYHFGDDLKRLREAIQ